MSQSQHWTTLRDLDVARRTSDKKPPSQPLVGKTEGQTRYLEAISKYQLTFCIGPSGTGKSYLAIGYAVQQLMAEKYKKLILVRPMVECGRELGAMPGELHEKLSPYMESVQETLCDFLDPALVQSLIREERIVMTTFETMRGKTFKDCVVILDEAQNADEGQMLMFLTRIGERSKIIVNGDTSGQQNDLSRWQHCGLSRAWEAFKHKDIGKVKLTRDDIVRSGLVKIIIEQWERWEDNLDQPVYGS